MSEVDPFDPVGAYIKPIRSVLFIDDQFPRYAQEHEAAEVERARALWTACTEQGWLCDIDNSATWETPERRRRLASSDLLVLDYHLVGDDTVPALSIIRDLARDPAPNLVVVYTRGPQLDDVLLEAASWARGVSDTPVPEHLEELEDTFEWTRPERIAFLAKKESWKAPIEAACRDAEITTPDDRACAALLERRLRREYNVKASCEICPIDEIEHGEHRWFRCGNLFLVVVGKPTDLEPEAEAEAFLSGLETAVRSWSPPWLACLMAHSRRNVEAGAFRDDVRVPELALQNGLLGYIGGSDDESERKRRATEVAAHLLSQRSSDAAVALGSQLRDRAASQPGMTLDEADLLHLNAFLCSRSFDHHHLHVGTIFVLRDPEPQYWVCVTPACDMVPRLPDEKMNPWMAELDEFRPVLALRLKRLTGESDIRKKALQGAHRARHLFFWDRAASEDRPIVVACFQETADPNPWLEQMLAVGRARVREDHTLQLYRLVARKDQIGRAPEAPELEPITCEPVAQLRAPYAERVVQVVGGHVSRIGVDFVPLRK
jgi:hypothetical protein